jgi:G3E family GTPase
MSSAGKAAAGSSVPVAVNQKELKKAIAAAQALGDKGKIPVTILTGFLGSGKTTFVNYLLKEKHGYKIAIIENEFGEVGIDDGLVLQTNEEVIEMLNGCICCTVRDDLIVALKRLITQRRHQFDLIVIETTGLADPAPVAQTFFVDEDIQELFKLDAIVTFVDAKHTLEHLREEKPEGVENEAVEQVAFADVLVVNKTDLVTPEELGMLKTELRSINASAKMYECQQSRVSVDSVINIGAFDLQKTIAMDEAFLDTEGEHMHDKSVSSVGIVIEGEFFGEKLNQFLSNLLRTKGADIYRSKGILAIVDDDRKFVFQGVHMLLKMGSSEEFDMQHKNWQPGEKRMNRLCFIGKNLNRAELEEQLKACIFNGQYPEPGPVPTDPLRFNVGEQVLCNVGTWEPSTIVKHWYREALWDTGKYVPYQAQVRSTGSLIYVPRDHPSFIRPLK